MTRLIETLARLSAYLGGLTLAALALMTVASITGRRLGVGPVTGDYELVANGVALSVFAFLPWCQLRRGHVTVDLFVDLLPARAKAALGLLGDVLVTLAAAVILRQLWLGFGEKFPHGSDALRERLLMGARPYFPETTYELEIPVWLLYGVAVALAALFLVASLHTVGRSLGWVIAGAERVEPSDGAT